LMTNRKQYGNPRNLSRRVVRSMLALVLLSGTALGGYAVGHQGYAGEAIKPVAPAVPLPDFSAVVARVKPAVVSITTRMQTSEAVEGAPFPFPFPFRGFGPMQPRQRIIEARGSGFIIDPNGLIVTNNHVVRNAKSVTVTLEDGTELKARILGRDARTDLALLKVDPPHPLSYVQLGDSDKVQPGQWVLAMGNPFGLGGTVTAGIVSALGRDIGEGPYDDFIQVDAPINQGNSGGPLFTQSGEVIGVTTAILSPTGGNIGIGFAIPSNVVKNVISQLETTGHVTRGWIGVSAQPVDRAMSAALGLPEDKQGALLASVLPDSPAAHAGLQPGDVIVGVDGQKIKSPHDLALQIAAKKPGASVNIDILRNGESKTVTATIGTQPQEQAVADTGNEGSAEEQPHIGVALQPLTPELREQLDVPRSLHGVVVAGVEPGSPADAAGIEPGDVILGVGGHAVRSPEDAIGAIRSEAHRRHAVALRVWRNGQVGYAAIDLRHNPAESDERG